MNEAIMNGAIIPADVLANWESQWQSLFNCMLSSGCGPYFTNDQADKYGFSNVIHMMTMRTQLLQFLQQAYV